MKISKRMIAYLGLAGCLCLIGFVLPVGGQAPAVSHAPATVPGGWGRLDLRTGTFTPLIKPNVIQDFGAAPNVAIIPTTGQFYVNFTILVKSPIPAGDVIACGVSASVFDTSGYSAIELATVAASRSGNSATCQVFIPYSWLLATPSSDTVSLSYTVDTPAGGTSPLPSRYSDKSISTGPVPATDSVTTIDVSPVI